MSLGEVKKYLNIDFNDDDTLITLFIEVAKDYVSNGFGIYDPTNPGHKILLLKAVLILYENRESEDDKVTCSIKLQQKLKGYDGI